MCNLGVSAGMLARVGAADRMMNGKGIEIG
jgi:hypothetical protein